MSTAPSVGSDWSQAVQSWFNEYVDYKYGKCCSNGAKQTGHYTQVYKQVLKLFNSHFN